MKKQIISGCVLFSLFTGSAFSNVGETPEINCSYSGDFQTCVQANINGSPRSIKDFVCLDRAGDWQEVLSQIILDKKFTEIDEEIEEYIEKLENSKEQNFGPNATESVLRAIDDIESNLPKDGYFWKKYENLCKTGILAEIAECTDGVTTTEAEKYLGGQQKTSCLALIETKLSFYREVSYNVVKLNKIQVRKDERKKYVQQERTRYDNLLDLQRNIVGNLERMLNGWVTKTKQTALKILDTITSFLV